MSILSGKVACVTGATSGFGRATAQQLVAEGANVIITGRREDRLDELCKELGSAVHPLCFDVSDLNAVQTAYANLPEAFSKIDILINNAGLARGTGSFENQRMEDLQEMVNTNILGIIYTTQTLLPRMLKHGQGHIINVGSIAGVYPYPGANVYGGTKAFVAQFSLNLRADLVDKNIRVTCIEPGLAETEFSLVRMHGNEKAAKDVYKGTKPLTGNDTAASIVWALKQPPHVNINRMELMPTQQACAAFAIARDTK